MADPLITSPKPFCFVLMPFSSDFDDVYRIGIKEACEAAGAYSERVDEQIFDESILERVYNQIAKADLIVADMTGRNPNVFYEVGYAHALGTRTILLTKNADDIPFDLRHFPHIVYGNSIASLRDDLKTRVQYFINNPVKTLGDSTIDIELFVGQRNLSSRDVIQEFPEGEVPHATLIIHNASATTFEPGAFKIGVITGSDLPRARFDITTTAMPDGKFLHMCPDFPTLFPKAYTSYAVVLEAPTDKPKSGDDFPLTIRVFTRAGTRDFTLTLRKA